MTLEYPNSLPNGWAIGTIEDLIGCGGIFADGDWVESKDQDPDGEVRLIQLADITDGQFRNRSNRFLTMAKANELRCSFLEADDVLIARMPDPLGRACLYPGSEQTAVTVVDVCIVRVGVDSVLPRWLMWFVNCSPIRNSIEQLQKGTTRKRISRRNLATIAIPIPPLAEQHRIVAEIETQLTRLDAAVAALKRAQANLKRYRAAVLKAACEGRLVPGEEAIDDLDPHELLRPIGMTNHDFVIPRGWRVAPLSEITMKIGDVDHNMPRAVESGVPYVSTKDFVELNGIDYANAKQISVEDFNRLSRKIKPERGDLLISRYGTIGQVRLIAFDQPFQASYSSAIVKTGSDLVLTSFLVQVLRSEIGQSQMRKEVRASSQPDLGLESIRNLLIPFPDIDTQSRIVVEIDRRNSLLDDMEKTVVHGLKRAERLRQAILRKAFAGQLVPQDPNDEPASVLLERMRAERAAAVPVKNGGRARKNVVQLRLE